MGKAELFYGSGRAGWRGGRTGRIDLELVYVVRSELQVDEPWPIEMTSSLPQGSASDSVLVVRQAAVAEAEIATRGLGLLQILTNRSITDFQDRCARDLSTFRVKGEIRYSPARAREESVETDARHGCRASEKALKLHAIRRVSLPMPGNTRECVKRAAFLTPPAYQPRPPPTLRAILPRDKSSLESPSNQGV